MKTPATEFLAKQKVPYSEHEYEYLEHVQRHTGYQVGRTSPFGLRKPLPVFMERTILELPAKTRACSARR